MRSAQASIRISASAMISRWSFARTFDLSSTKSVQPARNSIAPRALRRTLRRLTHPGSKFLLFGSSAPFFGRYHLTPDETALRLNGLRSTAC